MSGLLGDFGGSTAGDWDVETDFGGDAVRVSSEDDWDVKVYSGEHAVIGSI